MEADGKLFSIELKTGQVKMLCEGKGFHNIVPYSSWCTLALEAAAASTDEEPTTCASSASKADDLWVSRSSGNWVLVNHNECKLSF